MSHEPTGTEGAPPRNQSRDHRSPGDRVHGRRPADVYRRRRLVVLAAAAALVVVLALLAAFVWPGFAKADPEPAPAVTVTAPPPSPTVSPAPREVEQSAFSQALPDTVLALVQTRMAEHAAWIDEDDAVEAWELDYADGTGPDATTVRLVAGQWADDGEAQGAYDALLAEAGEPTQQGEVQVDGAVVGAYAVTPGSGAEEAVLTWRNGTAVLQATGPAELVEDFYSAYPL